MLRLHTGRFARRAPLNGWSFSPRWALTAGYLRSRRHASGWLKAHEVDEFRILRRACDSGQGNRLKVWKNDVEQICYREERRSRTATDYSIEGTAVVAPRASGPRELLEQLSRAICSTCCRVARSCVPETIFSVAIVHQYYTSDTRHWPTPVASFLRSGKWMPADDPQAGGAIRDHFPPSDVWTSGPSGERFPYCLRQPAVGLSKAIERVGEVGRKHLTRRRSPAGTRGIEQPSLNKPGSGRPIPQRTVNRHYEPQFINLYSATWKAIADWYATDPECLRRGHGAPGFWLCDKAVNCWRRHLARLTRRPSACATTTTKLLPALSVRPGYAILDVKEADPARAGAVFSALYGDRIRLVSEFHYDVRADNVPIDELPHRPTALDVCAWLRPMTAFAIEALTGIEAGQLPTDRSSLLARLDIVGMQFATDVEIALNGAVVSPSRRRRTYLFRRADATPLVVALHSGPVTWAVVEDCMQAICDAIDLPQIATRMRLLARDLDAEGIAVGEKEFVHGDLELLGRTLDLDEHALASAHYLLGDHIDANLPWIRAVVHLIGGADAFGTFEREVGAIGDPNLLRVVLAPLLAPGGMSADMVIDACRRSFRTENLREQLGFTLAAFNESLVATGSKPETYPELHANQVLHFVTENEVEIIQALRNKVAKKLERREAAPEYVQLRRDIRSIAPDPAWLPLYKNVPDEVVATHVKAWLAEAGAPPLGENPNGLPLLQTVRK